MAKGGFKMIVNGKIRRCCKIEADYDSAFLKVDGGKAEDFNRSNFAVMTVTKDDTPDDKKQSQNHIIREMLSILKSAEGFQAKDAPFTDSEIVAAFQEKFEKAIAKGEAAL